MKWFKNLNTPNKLTLIRMICVLFVIVLATLETYSISFGSFVVLENQYTIIRVIILFLFIFASITDFLDGMIARKNNIVTTFGKFLDPIADKLLVNSLTIILAIWGEISIIIPIIFIARDTIVDGIRMIAVSKNVVIAASKLGKLKTITQMIAIIFVLVLGPMAHNIIAIDIIGQVLVYLSALISLISGIEYFVKNRHFVLEGANDK